jgi:Tfp pilus assembly protein PilX
MKIPAHPSSQRGIVLPVVLIMMVILTSLVLTQIRRSTIDRQLAVNTRAYSLAESATQTVLRKCEAYLLDAGDAPSSASGSPAWRDAAQWKTNMVNLESDAQVTYPGVAAYGCLYENASAEMAASSTTSSLSAEVGDDGIRKYRVTARVVLTSGQQLHLQSELRFDRNSD